MKTTHIEIVRYSRTIVRESGNPPTVETNRRTIDVTPKSVDVSEAAHELRRHLKCWPPLFYRLRDL